MTSNCLKLTSTIITLCPISWIFNNTCLVALAKQWNFPDNKINIGKYLFWSILTTCACGTRARPITVCALYAYGPRSLFLEVLLCTSGRLGKQKKRQTALLNHANQTVSRYNSKLRCLHLNWENSKYHHGITLLVLLARSYRLILTQPTALHQNLDKAVCSHADNI